MSGKELDKLFRDKLEGLSPEPRAGAWESVQAQMGNEKGVWFYVKIAAAILLLISFASLYFLNTNSPEAPVKSISQNSSVDDTQLVDTVKIDSVKKIPPHQEVPAMENNTAALDTSEIKNETKPSTTILKDLTQKPALAENVKKVAPKESQPQIDSTFQKPVLKNAAEKKALVAENNITDATSNSNTTSIDQAETERGSTLVFDIDDFDVKTAVTSAYEAAEETKKSGFKKVLDFVKSVKGGEAGLGGLREAKNNLLSIKQKEKEDDNSR
ncbi:MAG: hypothetical protein AAGG59_01075 [Bacteroidota bacterium]